MFIQTAVHASVVKAKSLLPLAITNSAHWLDLWELLRKQMCVFFLSKKY